MIKYDFRPKDFIALLLIGGYVVYVIASGNTMIPATVMLVVGYYFARRDEPDHTGVDDTPKP